MFVMPLVCIGWWFLRNPSLQFPRRSFWWTIGVLAPSGIVLDLLFGNEFFLFENTQAVLGIAIPAMGGPIPIEEFVFYISGFMLILLTYIWCDEYWLREYNIPDYTEAAKDIHRIVQFHPASVVLGVVLLGAAFVYKIVIASIADGIPSYFTYLVLAAIIPSAGFFETAKPFINWRALAFTLLPILLISLLWEVTLAVPYRWWGYKPDALIGIEIGAWSNLPVEAVCVWFTVTFATVITYEVIKIWQAMGTRALEAFFGIGRVR